jgi:hypothetical protein
MGIFRDSDPHLPYLRASEWQQVVRAEQDAFRRWKGKGSNPELRGIVLYDALMHTGRGFKILEEQQRGQHGTDESSDDDEKRLCGCML